jgi:hypothetical protein
MHSQYPLVVTVLLYMHARCRETHNKANLEILYIQLFCCIIAVHWLL